MLIDANSLPELPKLLHGRRRIGGKAGELPIVFACLYGASVDDATGDGSGDLFGIAAGTSTADTLDANTRAGGRGSANP